MSVKIREKKTSKTSKVKALYLDIYHNGQRSYKFLDLHYKVSANEVDKQGRDDARALAKRIAAKVANDLASDDHSIMTDKSKNTVVVTWMQSYIDKYTKKDIRNMQGVLNRFETFLIKHGKKGLTFKNLTSAIITDFRDSLEDKCKGEGASSYYARFRKMIRRACLEKLMSANPLLEVVSKKLPGAIKKDTLELSEIQQLSSTPIDSPEVRRGFLFCCLTGLRWVDIKAATWSNVRGKKLILTQVKTKKTVEIDLNDTTLELLGKRFKPTDLLFDLPTANGANKTVKAWVVRAEIGKKITWHNARHSLGTNLIIAGEDLLTVSSILGHASTKHTERYVKPAEAIKKAAMAKMNIEL